LSWLPPRKEARVENFVHRKNIEHYKKVLGVTTNPAERAMILKLLAEETAKEPAPKKE
jgi:hypothetical protein